MKNWFHRLLNPHCAFCKEEDRMQKEENGVCKSCEILQAQLEIANIEKQKLLDRLLAPTGETIPNVETPEVPRPRFIPFSVRRQVLEAEDRKAAEVMRLRKKEMNETKIAPRDDPDVIALEREMDIIAKDRSGESGGVIFKQS